MRTASKIFALFVLAAVISVFSISGTAAPAQAGETLAEAKKLSARVTSLRISVSSIKPKRYISGA